jgi:hypothetical protein
MRQSPARSALLWMMCVAVAVALASRSDWWLSQLRWPRSLWPLLIACYLAWVALDGLRALCLGLGGRLKTVPCLRAGVGPSLVLVVLVITCGVEEVGRRWADFRSHARYHYLQEVLCRLSARGERGEVVLHFPYGCQVGTIPEAKDPAERVQMNAVAQRHARLQCYWESRW